MFLITHSSFSQAAPAAPHEVLNLAFMPHHILKGIEKNLPSDRDKLSLGLTSARISLNRGPNDPAEASSILNNASSKRTWTVPEHATVADIQKTLGRQALQGNIVNVVVRGGHLNNLCKADINLNQHLLAKVKSLKFYTGQNFAEDASCLAEFTSLKSLELILPTKEEFATQNNLRTPTQVQQFLERRLSSVVHLITRVVVPCSPDFEMLPFNLRSYEILDFECRGWHISTVDGLPKQHPIN